MGDDSDRDAILKRRNTFIAMALSGLTSMSAACDDGIPGVTPEPCLSVAPAEPQPCLVPPAELIPIETVEEKPADPPPPPPEEEELVDQTEEDTNMNMGTGMRVPRPCLRYVAPPHPCLTPARPCLSVARPPPPPPPPAPPPPPSTNNAPPPQVCLSIDIIEGDLDGES